MVLPSARAWISADQNLKQEVSFRYLVLPEQSGTLLEGSHIPSIALQAYDCGCLLAKSYPTLQCRMQNIPLSGDWSHVLAPFSGVGKSGHGLAFHGEKAKFFRLWHFKMIVRTN